MQHSKPFILFFTTLLLVSLACNAIPGEPPPPTQAPTSSIYAVSISVGGAHACALLNNGRVACWGDNGAGQLGDGTYTKRQTAEEVAGLTDIAAISAGGEYTCALMKNGKVKCWGRNEHGQLGNGTTENSMQPVDIPGLANVTAIYAGSGHACAIIKDGTLKCWGENLKGQLGNGSFSRLVSSPADVVGLGVTITSVSIGNEHTCVLTTNAGVKCWGHNSYGELGMGKDITQSKTPVDIVGIDDNAIAVATGFSKSCAITKDGQAKCWGWLGFDQFSNTPVNLEGLDGKAKSIAAGGSHICVVLENGAVRCLGENKKGQLGDGTTADSQRFAKVKGLPSAVTAIGAAYDDTCTLTTMGEVFCWGDNSSGQLGNGSTEDSLIPVKVVGINQ